MATPKATMHNVYGTGVHSDRQVRQVRDNLTRIFPESTPFFTLLNKTATVADGKANLLEWQYISEFPRVVTVAVAAAADATNITVASATPVQESQWTFEA